MREHGKRLGEFFQVQFIEIQLIMTRDTYQLSRYTEMIQIPMTLPLWLLDLLPAVSLGMSGL